MFPLDGSARSTAPNLARVCDLGCDRRLIWALRVNMVHSVTSSYAVAVGETEVLGGAELRQRRRVVGVRASTAVLLVLLSVVIAGGWVFAEFEPLGTGSMGGVTASGARTIDTLGEPESLIWLDHQEGEEFFAGYTIANNGPIEVTVERLLPPHLLNNARLEFHPVEALVHPGEAFVGENNIDYRDWVPFEPFQLAAGDERRVAIQYRFGDCRLSRGETRAISGYTTTFSVLGIDKDVEFQLPYTLAMKAKTNGGCP